MSKSPSKVLLDPILLNIAELEFPLVRTNITVTNHLGDFDVNFSLFIQRPNLQQHIQQTVSELFQIDVGAPQNVQLISEIKECIEAYSDHVSIKACQILFKKFL